MELDVNEQLHVRVEFAENHTTLLQYDSRKQEAARHGAYTEARGTVVSTVPPIVEFVLPGARFANRQNGGADFRLVVRDSPLAVRRVQVGRHSRPTSREKP